MKLPTRQRIVDVLKQGAITLLIDLDILQPTASDKERYMLREMEEITRNIGTAKTYWQLRNAHSMIYHWMDKYGLLAHKWYVTINKIYQNKEMELKGGGRC